MILVQNGENLNGWMKATNRRDEIKRPYPDNFVADRFYCIRTVSTWFDLTRMDISADAHLDISKLMEYLVLQ